ncbi:GIY-YIG nuclease family protein [Marinicauda algicola]|uniref:GIY-YIG nuclease family protein n=1 Tax=Marinicauda algicola TaxID=2029849 RepID=A0A4S2H258_9PROT|nr:GIY-YIG nuclease family protein [Marinicauda algicola]TGY89252.1 GIY-YIG nuclease family protein [Marinicauda algicola]
MDAIELGGFCVQLRTARSLCEGSVQVPNRAGVYLIALKLSSPIFRLCPPVENKLTANGHSFAVIYVGETWAVKNRLRDHLTGDWTVSNFRHSVLALTESHTDENQKALCEESLSEHLLADAIVGFCEPDFIGPAERALIQSLQPAFNIRGCTDAAWKKKLQKARKNFLQFSSSADNSPA